MPQNEPLKSADTNPQKGSVFEAPLEKKYICKLQIMKNKVMDDYLPIIPASSRVEKKKVLFHLEFEARVTDKNSGQPVPNKTLQFKAVPVKVKKLIAPKPTDKDGKTIVILETREQGDLKLSVKNPDVRMEEFPVSIKEAWYESKFELTHYVIYEESSHRFKGEMVDTYQSAQVPDGKRHKKDFLREVKMQGTGRTMMPDRPFLKYLDKKNIFLYVNKITGCTNKELKANHSIAVDPAILPFLHRVMIFFPSKAELGMRYAEDRGKRIKNYHFDLFMASEKERDVWVNKYGHTIYNAYVKYIGR